MSRALTLARANVTSSIRDIMKRSLEKHDIDKTRPPGAGRDTTVPRQLADESLERAYEELEEALDQWERALVNTLEDRQT